MTKRTLKNTIDIDLTRKWLAALESREVNGVKIGQTREQLVSNKGDTFCCLGVLCKVDGNKTKAVMGGTRGFFLGEEQDQPDGMWFGMPSERVLNKVGLTDQGTKSFIEAGEFASMNDDGHTFAEIAVELRKAYKRRGVQL